MEDLYEINNYQNKIDDDYDFKKDLPESSINKYTYEELIKLNKEYNKQLTETIETLTLKKKKLVLPKNDMQVLNNLLQENYKYLVELVPKTIYTVEFDNLYYISLSILNDLSQIELEEIKLYQKLQRLKFMELKFENLRFNGSRNDFLKAYTLLEEMEVIQNDKIVSPKISLVDISNLLLYKAVAKFYLEDIELSENYAFEALDILEKNKDMDDSDKKIYTISKILEFLVELYDLKKEYNTAISCYEKAFYLNVGKYGMNSEYAQRYKRKKNEYENYLNKKRNINNDSLNYNDIPYFNNYNDNNDLNNKKIMKGKCENAKGTAETFSFKIPITKNIEPMIISFYALSDDYEVDRFSSELFLKNIYLDKNKLFSFYGMNEHSLQQNYFLYTDEIVNDILSNITIEDDQIIIENPMVLDALINC